MIYFLSLISITYIGLANFFSHARNMTNGTPVFPGNIKFMLLQLSVLLVSLPIIFSILFADLNLSETHLSAIVVGSGVGGATILGIGLLSLLSVFKTSDTSFIKMGKPVVMVIAGAVILTGTLQHLWFFKDDGGVFYIANLPSDLSVADVECNRGLLLIDGMPDDTATSIKYRCPKMLVLLPHHHRPFVPWPDYAQGHSEDVATILKQFQAQAEEFEPGSTD